MSFLHSQQRVQAAASVKVFLRQAGEIIVSPEKHSGNQDQKLSCPVYFGFLLHSDTCNSKTEKGGGECTVNELNNVSNRHCFVIFYCLIVKTTDINLVDSLLMHSLQSLTSQVPHTCNYNVKQEENCGQSTCDKAVTSIKSPMYQKGKNEYIYPFVIPQVESNREQRATLLPLRNANISCLDSVFPTITWFLQQPEPFYFH